MPWLPGAATPLLPHPCRTPSFCSPVCAIRMMRAQHAAACLPGPTAARPLQLRASAAEAGATAAVASQPPRRAAARALSVRTRSACDLVETIRAKHYPAALSPRTTPCLRSHQALQRGSGDKFARQHRLGATFLITGGTRQTSSRHVHYSSFSWKNIMVLVLSAATHANVGNASGRPLSFCCVCSTW
jgi:hypothetical protein